MPNYSLAIFSLLYLILVPVIVVPETPKFKTEGSIIYYNTDPDDQMVEIEDVDSLKMILSNGNVFSKIVLTSGGGDVGAAYEISNLIIDSELNTEVFNHCESACTILFLAGKKRTFSEGGMLGFHQTSMSAKDAKLDYEDNKAENGWNTPFEFAAWMLSDTQEMVLNDLYFYQDRNLSLDFVIKTLESYAEEMWYPTEAYLRKEGIITE